MLRFLSLFFSLSIAISISWRFILLLVDPQHHWPFQKRFPVQLSHLFPQGGLGVPVQTESQRSVHFANGLIMIAWNAFLLLEKLVRAVKAAAKALAAEHAAQAALAVAKVAAEKAVKAAEVVEATEMKTAGEGKAVAKKAADDKLATDIENPQEHNRGAQQRIRAPRRHGGTAVERD